MLEPISTAAVPLRAILVAVAGSGQHEETTREHLDELEFLALTLGLETVGRVVQRLDSPDPRTFIGRGKADEVRDLVREKEIDLVVFDEDLSPSQLRNLEAHFKCRIYDRSLLILDIFLVRAKTAQAKTQVELARYQYLLPRLTRMWTHLERQRGGTGTRGGAGEKEIETDRRMIRNQIGVLKERLDKINRQNRTRRKSRGNIVRVSLVGYTNVGKSTLMNLLAKSNVYAEDKLFATLDSTVRKVVIGHIPFLLSDTVGFIRKLPHHLIESFQSTLDEVAEADILLHVVDVSHPAYQEQMEVVIRTLGEIQAGDKEIITVYNKIDLLAAADDSDPIVCGPPQVPATPPNSAATDVVYISAQDKTNLTQLRKLLLQKVQARHMSLYPNYLAPQPDGGFIY
jgi:GTPase